MKKYAWTNQYSNAHPHTDISQDALTCLRNLLIQYGSISEKKLILQHPWLAQWEALGDARTTHTLNTPALPQGVTIEPIDFGNKHQEKKWLNALQSFDLPLEALLNLLRFQQSYVITCEANQKITAPIALSHHWQSPSAPSMTPIIFWIKMGANSQMTLLETHTKNQDMLLKNSLYLIECAEGAQLDHQSYCAQDNDHAHRTYLASLASNSQYHLNTLLTEGAQQRQHTQINLMGQHARSQVNSLNFASKKNRHQFDCTITHQADATESTQNFSHLLYQSSQTTTNSATIIKKTTQGTSSEQLIDSKLLSPLAQTNPNPTLVVETPEVTKCKHAATTGTIDPNLLFYMQARGLEKQAAISLLLDQYICNHLNACFHPEALKQWQPYLREFCNKTIEKQYLFS